jgi:hypothetical protein
VCPSVDAANIDLGRAVTGVYKGSKNASTGQILLRSYDSRKETSVEPGATIWQAGRATCATLLAFKPIQVGQSVFLDEGVGKYNPAPMILDEAVCNEWPGREVGVFISIGTGKRPEGTNQQAHLWWEGFVSTGIGDFAEARRRLITKIEDCEKIHLSMKDHLAKRQVNPEHYYRLNVNVGVGEFGMNEWNRLAEISSSTRMYLGDKAVQSKTLDSSSKLARIHFAKLRWERTQKGQPPRGGPVPQPANPYERPLVAVQDASPLAIELPAEEVMPNFYSHQQKEPDIMLHPAYRRASDNDKFAVLSSNEYPESIDSTLGPRYSGEYVNVNRRSMEQFTVASTHNSPRVSNLSFEERPPSSPYTNYPPPRPPKTPFEDRPVSADLTGPPLSPPPTSSLPRPPPGAPLPYPDTDGPPPVNMSRKPEFRR